MSWLYREISWQRERCESCRILTLRREVTLCVGCTELLLMRPLLVLSARAIWSLALHTYVSVTHLDSRWRD